MNWIIQKWATHQAEKVRTPTKQVAIMVPLPSVNLSPDEVVSMAQLRKHLDGYDKYFLVPENVEVNIDGFKSTPLDCKHFGSAANHNRMLYRTDFWEKFADYEFVMMYHLDALVFSDQLEEWCGRGIDFIGAPFLVCDSSPWAKEERVGNGGFALYRVPSVLKVLWRRYAADPSKYWEDHCWKLLEFQASILRPLRAAVPSWLKGKATASLRQQLQKMDHIEVNERGNDLFWAYEATKYLPEFRIGTVDEGLAFAFETEPAACFKRTCGKLPFGCHAWGRYDREFWEKHLGSSQTKLAQEEHQPISKTA